MQKVLIIFLFITFALIPLSAQASEGLLKPNSKIYLIPIISLKHLFFKELQITVEAGKTTTQTIILQPVTN